MSDTVRKMLSEDGVAEILVDRPAQRNAMTMDMYAALVAHVRACAQDERVRCVLLRGAGGQSFIAGTDISYFQDFRDGSAGIEYEKQVESVVDAVERLPAPTVAVIDGWAVGGGLALAAACDFRVCSEKSRFGVPIARTLSNTLSTRNLARLVAAFGMTSVKRMLMLAEALDAQEARQCGFVHAVHPAESLQAEAHALALRLGELSRVTQSAVKESLRRLLIEQSMEDDDLIESVYGSEAFRQGVEGFLGRRPARQASSPHSHGPARQAGQQHDECRRQASDRQQSE